VITLMASPAAGARLIVMTDWSELRSVLPELARLRDPVGVLSITVAAEPRSESNRTPGWQIELRNDLAHVRREVGDQSLLEQRLEELGPQLDAIREPSLAERSHALYVALEAGTMTAIRLPTPLPTGARVARIAHLLPLVSVLAAGERTGLVCASRNVLELHESELGSVRLLESISLEPDIGDWWPEMKGPASPNPARGQQVVAQRDRYARRLADAYAHQLDVGAEALAAVARHRGWTRAVVAGERRLTRRLEASLAPEIATIATRGNLVGIHEAEVRRRLQAALAKLATEQALALVRETISEDFTGGRGVLGLKDTLAALGSGRVDRLLIDPERTFPGTVGADENLAADETGEDLGDWIVASALATDASVLPVTGAAAQALAPGGGIGALLRW
jgi:hypothetical protein